MKEKFAKVLNAAWKMGVALVGLWLMFSVVELIGARYGRARWMDKTISADVVVRAYRNDTWRVYNKRTGHFTTDKIRWVSGTPKRDSLTVFCDKNGYRGFLNVNTGEIVIPAQYGKAWQFSEGLAAVEYGEKQLGFINHDNELVMENIPHEPGYFDYLFKGGFCIIKNWDDITRDVLYTVYSSKTLGKVGEYKYISHLDRGGYMIAHDDEGYWLLDHDYKKVFAEPYDIMRKANDFDGVFVTRNWVKQLVDFDGNVVEPFVIDYTTPLSYVSDLSKADYDENGNYCGQRNVSEYEPDLVVYHVNEYQGLMNAHTGKIITPAKYGEIIMISRELLRADIDIYNYESVLLDRNGKLIEE